MMKPEVMEFRVPVGSDKTVFVWNISATASEEEISHSLWKILSQFGVLYSVRVCRNASVTEHGYYALVKFFSSRDAIRAQQICNKQRLFQESPLKVCLCTRQKEFQQHEAQKLNSVKCQDLANHYLGFNGWSKRIIALQNISGLDEQEGMAQTQGYSMKYICIVEIVLHNHGLCSRGVAVAEELLENHKDPLEFALKTGKVQKYAVQKALSDAFQKIILVVLENGKVAVQYRPVQEDFMDCLLEENLQGLIQVNDLSWKPCNQDEEEETFSELSFNEELEEDT
ncbi:RAD52 motif-containing protein 1 [Microcaecilia unicolor]|uniref:RAD52 motif-containing protein 1 n=1 Tax=Microcaecilia unicolor TaxID=1415580 RepID=A0A6P7ZC34_9AMPH|nr:RAD52 motif-containing protein 1 [Microcaecilia unicolor]